MNRRLISEALNQIDDGLIAEAATYLDRQADAATSSHVTRTPTYRKSYLRFALIAVCAGLVLTAAVFAVRYWGIREMLQSSGKDYPDGAEELLQQPNAYAETDTWNARITELMNDDHSIIACIMVNGGDQYVVVPMDANSYDSVSLIGLSGDQTLEEYAASKKKMLLFAGSYIGSSESKAKCSSFLHFERISDGEMKILICAQRNSDTEGTEVICTVSAWTEGRAAEEHLDFPLQLQDAKYETVVFVPNNPDSVPGIHVGEAEVTFTPLGVNVSFPIECEETKPPYRVECDELQDYGGGMVLDNETWRVQWFMGKGNIASTMTWRFYDKNDVLVGTIVFHVEDIE